MPLEPAPPFRPTLSLDGEWDFTFKGPAARLNGRRRIRSPGIWQTQFPELRNAHGVGRYRKRVDLPEAFSGKALSLTLEGVFHTASVLVDGRVVATGRTGWSDVTVDLTKALNGASSFILGVDADVPDDRGGDKFSLMLAGKQDWYGIHGGIWKPARIEACDATHLTDAAVSSETDLKNGKVIVKGRAVNLGDARLRLTVTRDGAAVADQTFAVGAEFDVALVVPDAALWSPDHPNLYDISIALERDGRTLDRIDRVTGFRRFEARDGKLLLNGEPFYMRAALDQDWYPQEDCRHPDAAFLEQRLRNAKSLGLNALRCHVKIPDRLYFDLADRLGLMIWQDMPYPEFLGPTTRDDLRDVFTKAVHSHGHHPSICIWTIFNEGWGVDLDDNPGDRRWLLEMFDEAKALAPQCLIVDNSPCFPRNYHMKTDIEDFHWYAGFPQHNGEFAATTDAFAARAPWAWSPHGDAVKSGKEPLVCSEFGVWGLPHPKDIREPDGSEPWWFESGHDWNQGAAYPHGIETRFRDAQLAPIFGDLDGFVDAAQEFQFSALKHQIETIRWAAPICGYVITELNDVQWEANGLMDVQNNLRRFAHRLAGLQTDWLVIARAPRTMLRAGETLAVPVRLSGAAAAPKGATLEWRFGAKAGAAPLSDQASSIAIVAPTGGGFQALSLELTARGADGAVLSRNAMEFCVAPALANVSRLFACDEGAAGLLKALAWPNVAARADEGATVLATRLSTPVREMVLAGRNVLVIANSADALVDPARKLPVSDRHNFPTMELRAREGTPWDGRWMGAFTWRRTDGAWADLPGGAMLDGHWAGLMPKHVLTGFMSTAFGGLIDSGMAVGWLHKAAAFSKRSALGKGWLQVTTFELAAPEGAANPLAPHLLAALARM